MFDGRPPFQELAFPEFKREFGDLFSVRAQVEDYEHGMIEGVMSDLFLMHLESGDRSHWAKTVRAAHYYLDRGALKDGRAVCEAYMRVADSIPHALNRVIEKRPAASDSLGDERIEKHLSLYKTMYEGLLPVIAAPVVVGFSRCYNSKAKEFVPKPDGRVNLRAIESMEKWSANPSNRLTEGLNGHVRNAFSHERYRILDGERVEMWDQDSRGRPTWGPETWTADQLAALCHRLHLTGLGIVAALALFGINHRQLIIGRGWVPQGGVQRPPLRFAEAQRLMESYAHYNSLAVTKFERDGQTLRMGFQTDYKGVDQDQEIIVGGEGWGRVYKKPVRYEQVLVAEIVIGMIQRAAHNMDDFERFHVAVKDEEDKNVGEFVITRAALQHVGGPRGAGVFADRRYAEPDTLGDALMWLKIEGEVRRVVPTRKPRAAGLIVPASTRRRP